MSFFVFNEMVALFVSFLFIFSSLFPEVQGPFRRPSRLVALRPLPTTMCPQNDHLSRLSQTSGFVKRKMQAKNARKMGIVSV